MSRNILLSISRHLTPSPKLAICAPDRFARFAEEALSSTAVDR